MKSQQTQVKEADNQLERATENSVSNESNQPVKKSPKLRPFAVLFS